VGRGQSRISVCRAIGAAIGDHPVRTGSPKKGFSLAGGGRFLGTPWRLKSKKVFLTREAGELLGPYRGWVQKGDVCRTINSTG
jgi:hypothetical protein